MSPADINNRTLRSGSQTPSQPGPRRSARQARARTPRLPSPAIAPVPPANDNAELGATKQSYGTENQLAELQLQGAATHGRAALNSISNAVDNAAAELSAVHEGTEGNAGLPQDVPDVQFTDQNVQPTARNVQSTTETAQPTYTTILSRFSRFFWGARFQTEEDRDSVYSELRSSSSSSLSDDDESLLKKWSWLIKLVLAALLLGFVGYNYATVMNYTSDFKSYLPTTTNDSTPSGITAHDYKLLKHRLDMVEQHLHDLPTFIAPSDSTPQQQINWFTPGFGAIVDVGLSSPTTTFCDPKWGAWPWGVMFKRACPQLPISPPHKMVLQSWDDPTLDRWCAPRSGGKLQLAIEVERPILPTELVVEYMSKQASPEGYMSTAPKELELWIRVEDDDVRAKLNQAITRLHPELWENSSPQGKELILSRDLGEKYVPVGRWMYDIYAPSHVQGFKMAAPLLELGVQTTKVAIRVNSNWGNVDYTCINRFRMHGVDVSGYKEYPEVEGLSVEG